VAKFQVQLEGCDREAGFIRDVPERLKENLLRAFIQSATEIAAQASDRAPKGKTGELAGSMHIHVSDKGKTYSVNVGPDAYYAGWVESGHQIGKRKRGVSNRLHRALVSRGYATAGARVPPHPFFMPTVERLRSSFQATIARAIADAEKGT
jgi:hypothetical protein